MNRSDCAPHTWRPLPRLQGAYVLTTRVLSILAVLCLPLFAMAESIPGLDTFSQWGPEWLLIFLLGLAIGWLVKWILQKGYEMVMRNVETRKESSAALEHLAQSQQTLADNQADLTRAVVRLEKHQAVLVKTLRRVLEQK